MRFFYALLHFLVYIVFDQGLSLSYTYEDIVERPFITVGFAALCILLALALTSTNGWRRRLRAGWKTLASICLSGRCIGVVTFYLAHAGGLSGTCHLHQHFYYSYDS